MKKARRRSRPSIRLAEWMEFPYETADGPASHFIHKDSVKLRLLVSRLGHATGWMRTDEHGKPRSGLAQSQNQIADFCDELLARVADETKCNDPCKMMYFCDRKKGHKGRHREDSGLAWE